MSRPRGPAGGRPAAGARSPAGDERAVSTTLGYILNLAVATLVVTGILIAGGDLVDDQREQTVRTELEVIGHQVAADLVAADELAATADAGDTVEVRRNLPRDVAGRTYQIEFVPGGGSDPHLLLRPTGSDVVVRVDLDLETELAASTVDGREIVIRYADVDGDPAIELEVQND